MARNIVAEVCPGCGSLDVRAAEPRWFRVEFERREATDDGWLERLEFSCRDCAHTWE
jgi:acetone carboxylase gamma subunit